jgi:hypothetical protein
MYAWLSTAYYCIQFTTVHTEELDWTKRTGPIMT